HRRGGVVVADDDGLGCDAGQGVVGAIRIGIRGGDVNLVGAEAVAVEVERAGGIGGAVDLDVVPGDADGDGAEARAGIRDIPGEELILAVVLGAGGAAEGDDRGRGVVVGDGDRAGHGA